MIGDEELRTGLATHWGLADATISAHHGGMNLNAYLDETTLLSAAHVEQGMPSMVRFRWAVQADYFARRIATGDLTGISTRTENEKGLEDARLHLITASHTP